MKRIPAWLIVILIFSVLIAVKFLFLNKKEQGAGPGKGKTMGPVSVNYIVASTATISQDVYTAGRVGAMNELTIKPEIQGRVISVNFREGSLVNKGELLVQLNDAELKAQLQKNKALLRLAEEKAERLKKLLEIKGVSQEEFDSQQNEIETLKADQSFLTAQLAKTSIVAPFSGQIGLKNISEGDILSVGQSITSLVQLDPVYVEFSVPEKYAHLLKKDLLVDFTLDRKVSSVLTASVYAIEPRIDEVTKTLKARALYKGKEQIYPGSFVKVFLKMGGSEESILLPTQCVIPIFKGQKVYLCKGGKMQEAKVITGIRTEDKIQILDGISTGDTVLTTGLMTVKKDSPLKLMKQ